VRGCDSERERDSRLAQAICTVDMGRDGPTEVQMSLIRVLIFRAHLLELIISIAFIGLAVFAWWGRSNSEASLLAGAALMVAGAMVFLFAMKSILKFTRR
jgi:hypothetical protein